MVSKIVGIFFLFILLVFLSGCSTLGEDSLILTQSMEPGSDIGTQVVPPGTSATEDTASLLPTGNMISTLEPQTPAQTASPTFTITTTPTQTEVVFAVGEEITIEYLQQLEINGSEITFEQQLADRSNYHQHLVSYISEGNKIYGLLTIPFGEPPQGGFKAIVFNHGYIPPAAYQTTERYTAYVDYLARNGFVVFKIDYRGHGQSQGEPTGSYFSPGYTIDAITALKSLQMLDFIDPQGIGMWGHSMAGNLVLRAMLVEPQVKAGVIWAGAVYSYDDFAQYGITDNTYRPPATPETEQTPSPRRRSRQIFDVYGRPDTSVDYWRAVSLTENIQYLNSPLQLHHALDDSVVNVAYSIDLAAVLQESGKDYEFFTYEGGGHNLTSPYFEQAMQRTVEFFRENL
jgi:dipeptidyl aminopeptidase/acylaminoacyl peptidase